MKAVKEIVCSVCNCSNLKKVGTARDHEYNSSETEYDFLRCQACHTLRIDPTPGPAALSLAYPKEYYSFHLVENYLRYKDTILGRWFYTSLINGFISNFKSLSKIINKNYHDVSVLDYGSGEGFNLRILSELGLPKESLYGYEPNSGCNNECFNIVSDLRSLKGKKKFDVIIASHVIEHLPDPVTLFEDSQDLLADNGVIIIVMPTPEGLHFKLTKSRHWGGYHVPRHFNLITRQGLAKLTQNYPLQLYSIRALDDSWIMAQTINSFLSILPKWTIPEFVKRSFFATYKEEPTVARSILYGILSIMSKILTAFDDRSSNTEIIYKKISTKFGNR